jgi:hypothetical protein
MYIVRKCSCFGKKRIPEYTVFGCRFHGGQSWFIKIQQKAILLTQYKDEKSDVSKLMDSFFTSSLLLPDEEFNGFTELKYQIYQMIQLLT